MATNLDSFSTISIVREPRPYSSQFPLDSYPELQSVWCAAQEFGSTLSTLADHFDARLILAFDPLGRFYND